MLLGSIGREEAEVNDSPAGCQNRKKLKQKGAFRMESVFFYAVKRLTDAQCAPLQSNT